MYDVVMFLYDVMMLTLRVSATSSVDITVVMTARFMPG